MAVRHAFASGKSDGADATLVRPSNWNADHVGMPDGAFNIIDYGAVGDDSTDNTSAIASAKTAAGTGGRVFVPAGIYRTDGITPLANQVWVMAPGATLKLRGATAPLWNCTAKGVRLYGGKLDQNSVDGHCAWFDSSASPAGTERGGGLYGVEITGVPAASNGTKYSVYIAAAFTQVIDCYVHDTDNGIKFVAANVRVEGNRLYNVTWTGIGGQGAGKNVAKASRLRGCKVLNNNLIESPNALQSFGIEIVNGFSNLEVAHNYLQGTNASISLVGQYQVNCHHNEIYTALTGSYWIIEINGYDSNVHANIVEGAGGSTTGIAMSGANSGAGYWNDRTSVRDNTITDVQTGIAVNWDPGGVVENNTIHNASYAGIGCNVQATGDTSNDLLIAGNRISNDARGSTTGIELATGSSARSNLVGNLIRTVNIAYALTGDGHNAAGNYASDYGTLLTGSPTNFTQAANSPAIT